MGHLGRLWDAWDSHGIAMGRTWDVPWDTQSRTMGHVGNPLGTSHAALNNARGMTQVGYLRGVPQEMLILNSY